MKSVFLLAVFAVSFISMTARDSTEVKIAMGPRFGLCFTSSRPSVVDGVRTSEGNPVGFMIGWNIEIPFRKVNNLYFITGLSYLSKPIEITYDEDVELKTRPRYFEVPALLAYHFRVKSKLALRINAGMYGAIGVRGNINRTSGLVESEQKCFGVMNRFDYGYVIGLGLVNNRKVCLDINFEQGIPQMGGSSRLRFKNKVLMISIGGNI